MYKRLIIALLILCLAAACGPSESTQAPPASEPPPAQPPASQGKCGDGVCDGPENAQSCPQDCTAPSTEPLPGGKCGDGVCDGPEDAQNCPQDCAEAAAPATGAPPAGTGAPDYEPPINVFLVLHIDPVMSEDSKFVIVTPEVYQQTRDELAWLKQEVERHGMRFTALYNGWYTQEALELDDLDQFRAQLEDGHEIGTHAHRLTYDAAQDLWISRVDELSKVAPITYDTEIARQTWADAHHYMEEVLTRVGASDQNQTVCAVGWIPSDEPIFMKEFGFSIAAGQRGESSIQYFGHIVWNPWRSSSSNDPAYGLAEDLSTEYIAIPHLAQIGIRGGVHGMDLALEHIQRRFLMLYTEWLSRERTGAEDKIWSFGFVYHPEDGDDFNDTLAQFLTWLDENYIGKTSSHGNTIAQYATIGEIADRFTAWEAEHPGTSSFSYVMGDTYPYTYPALPEKLGDAAYEGRVDLGPGVTAFRFSKDGAPVYLLWSDQGERTIDFSQELSGQVSLTDGSGNQSTADASAILLREEPLFVEPLQ